MSKDRILRARLRRRLSRPPMLAILTVGMLFVATLLWAVGTPVLLLEWGQNGTDAGDFKKPHDAAVDSSGDRVYVADRNNNRIQVFDSDGEFVSMWGKDVDAFDDGGSDNLNVCTAAEADLGQCKEGDGVDAGDKGEFQLPTGVAVDPDNDRVYVADLGNHRIQAFDLDGNFELMWGFNVNPSTVSGSIEVCTKNDTACKSGQQVAFKQPTDVALDSDGNVYVADKNNHRIQKFVDVDEPGFDGTDDLIWAGNGPDNGAGNGAGQLRQPEGVAVDSDGNVYVADTGNHRIQVFGPDPDSEPDDDFLLMWGRDVIDNGAGNTDFEICTVAEAAACKVGKKDNGDGELKAPAGIDVDSENRHVYVADQKNKRVQLFDFDGNFLTRWSTDKRPFGLEVDAQANVYVAGVQADNIQKYGPIPAPVGIESVSGTTIHLRKRQVKVLLLSSEGTDPAPDFVPGHVDISTLTFGATGNEDSLRRCKPVTFDFNNDGVNDLECYFKTNLMDLTSQSTTVKVKAETVDGDAVQGILNVNIIGRR